jgi:hypothetical protein
MSDSVRGKPRGWSEGSTAGQHNVLVHIDLDEGNGSMFITQFGKRGCNGFARSTPRRWIGAAENHSRPGEISDSKHPTQTQTRPQHGLIRTMPINDDQLVFCAVLLHKGTEFSIVLDRLQGDWEGANT